MADVLLRAEGVSKRFGNTQALSDVSVSFRAGEVHALMGENGAGKSTLGKVIAGLHKADTGTVTIGGQALRGGSIDDAFSAGVRIVHQELAQCPNLTVAENLCLHDIPRSRLGLVDRIEMNRRASVLLRDLDEGIEVASPLGQLAPGRRQIVQIAGAIDERADEGGARVIVLDEPTSSLSIAETERLMQIVRRLAGEGLTLIYVSHRMGEIFECCDRVSVLRDGRYVATSTVAEIDEPALIRQMIGRTLSTGSDEAAHEPAADVRPSAAPLLDVRSMSSPGRLRDVSFNVCAGEILGVGGLVGAGRSELLDAIFGLDRRAAGSVLIDGTPIGRRSAREAIRAGVGYVPEDRRLQGLFFDLGVDENILMPHMPRLARAGVRSRSAESALVRQRMGRFRVKAATATSLPGELSGGNQQKLLIARWMAEGTRVLLLDEPTRGIDVGTKSEIYRLINEAAAGGTAVVLVSSEMPELLALSDRILVLADGRVTGELVGAAMTQAAILELGTREAR